MAQSGGEITLVLQAATSADPQARNAAEAQLQQAEQQNAGAYIAALSSELANSEKPAAIRQIAGILLKNAVDAPGADSNKKVI
jgi:importin subunit beta-1